MSKNLFCHLARIVPGTEEGWPSIVKQFVPFILIAERCSHFYYKISDIVKYFNGRLCKGKSEFYVLHENFTLLSTNQIAFHVNKLLWDKRNKAKSEPPHISKTWHIVYEN